MNTRSYLVAVVTLEKGQRVAHHGYVQLCGELALSGANNDEVEIQARTLNTFPDAVAYLPMRIPDRQYHKMEREMALRNAVGSAINTFTGFHMRQEADAWEQIEVAAN